MTTYPRVTEDRSTVGSAPPFAVGRATTSSWREHALTRVAEHRFLLLWLGPQVKPVDEPSLQAIAGHLNAAEEAAEGRTPTGRWKRVNAAVSGASVERARSHLDAAESELLRLAPDGYLLGQLPSLVAHVRAHLAKDDPRRLRIEELYQRAALGADPRAVTDPVVPLREGDRDAIVAAVRHSSSEARREVTRVRSFRNLLVVSAICLTVGAVGIGVVGALNPTIIPLCFNPDGMVVCPTEDSPVPWQAGGSGEAAPAQTPEEQAGVDDIVRDTVHPWDVPLIEIVGLLAAAVAAAAALRGVRGTSTEYSLPVALALLKLPTGALTALLGLLLMRGEFVPGLSALDSSAQIIAWAIVFGYAQQLLTRFVDQRAQGVLADVEPFDRTPGRDVSFTPAPA